MRLPSQRGVSGAGFLTLGLSGPGETEDVAPLPPGDFERALFHEDGPGLRVAVFSDYFCPVCPEVGPLLRRVRHPLNVTWHDWPVLGPRSVFAARLSSAAATLAPAGEVHDHLMVLRPRPSDAGMRDAADALDLPPDRFREALSSPAVDTRLARSAALAWQLGLAGTPAFVVGRVVLSGLPGLSLLRRTVRAELERGVS